MGQRTLAFTKQMLRVFDLVELEELDHLVTEAWPSIPQSSETNRDLIATRSEDEQAAPLRLHEEKNHDSRSYGRGANAFMLNQY
jgi:hypothetical protein